MPELNFNLLAPSSELYSGPQVKLDPQAAYEAAQAQQQTNMLSQLYAKHYDPQTGGINYNSLIGEAAQNPLTARAIPKIMEGAQSQAKAQADLSQTQAQQKQNEAAAARSRIETQTTYDENRHKEVQRAIRDISNYANKADALNGIEKSYEAGKIDDAAYGNLMNMVKNEPIWARSQGKILQSLMSEKEQHEIMQAEETERKKVARTEIDKSGTLYQFNSLGQVVSKTPNFGKVEQAAKYDQYETDENGVVYGITKGGTFEKIGAIGKPSAGVITARTKNQQLEKDLDRAIVNLEDITKEGGLIDQSTGSGIGAAVDVAAGWVGKSTPGAIAVDELRPIYDLVLKMVPRFEGPQSDKDTLSYQQAAGQLADPKTPNDRKKAAANTILRLMKERKDQFTSKDMEAAGVERTPPAASTAQTAPKAAIDYLLKNPSTAAQFDEMFGAGASAKYLKKGK
jgi:hypothetical protein